MNKRTNNLLLALATVTMTAVGVSPARADGEIDGDGANVPAPVAAALASALVVPNGTLTVRSFKATGGAGSCSVREASLERPIEGSGRFPVKVSGRGCSGWAWADVKVHARVLVTTRPVRAGDSLESAVTEEQREVRPPLRELASGLAPNARASRALSRGQIVEQSHLQAAGAAPGSMIKVVIQAGSLQVVQSGRVVPCGRGRICAVVPSGKHVEGEIVDGRLIVEAL